VGRGGRLLSLLWLSLFVDVGSEEETVGMGGGVHDGGGWLTWKSLRESR